MNSKQIALIGGVSVLVILGSVFAFRTFGGSNKNMPEVTPSPTVSYKPVEGVDAVLTPNAQKTKVTLALSGFDSRFSALEYELSYETDNNGTQGAFTADPIDISGQEEFEREIELGSCSTGGKCSYDKGVRNFKLTAKFHVEDGQVYILQQEFPTI